MSDIPETLLIKGSKLTIKGSKLLPIKGSKLLLHFRKSQDQQQVTPCAVIRMDANISDAKCFSYKLVLRVHVPE